MKTEQRHSRTRTSKQGILNCRFSRKPRINSAPPELAVGGPCEVTFRIMPSMAALASDPPVPLIAVMAIVAVSRSASDRVELPPRNDDAVSDGGEAESSVHRGSNQSALKSKREKMSTKSRIEQ